MKKFFVAVALVMGLGTTVAFAENLISDVETVMAVNDFTPIEVKDLPAAVQEAITKNYGKRLRDSILSPIFHSYIFAMYKNESLWI